MAERITTARPYAKAIFALARQNDTLAATAEGLALSAEVVANPSVHALLGSPHVTAAQLSELVNGIAGAKLDEHGRNFITLLAQNRRLGFLPEIAALFAQMKAEVENAVDVEVTSATALTHARPGSPLRGRVAEEARAQGAPAHADRPVPARWRRAQGRRPRDRRLHQGPARAPGHRTDRIKTIFRGSNHVRESIRNQ
jgi:ATP synthase F1 delta subunit